MCSLVMSLCLYNLIITLLYPISSNTNRSKLTVASLATYVILHLVFRWSINLFLSMCFTQQVFATNVLYKSNFKKTGVLWLACILFNKQVLYTYNICITLSTCNTMSTCLYIRTYLSHKHISSIFHPDQILLSPSSPLSTCGRHLH